MPTGSGRRYRIKAWWAPTTGARMVAGRPTDAGEARGAARRARRPAPPATPGGGEGAWSDVDVIVGGRALALLEAAVRGHRAAVVAGRDEAARAAMLRALV